TFLLACIIIIIIIIIILIIRSQSSSFNLFHVCPNMSAECPWCQKSWIQFHRKCYFFSGDEVPLKTWQESRQFCQNVSADLVVIHNQQQQVRAETAAGQQFSTGNLLKDGGGDPTLFCGFQR
uniref:C-type lectin domain-containing protein n=1 Tax=Oryzias latipes TaxID=8090 RepID=A0A3B3HZH0_ORYLA